MIRGHELAEVVVLVLAVMEQPRTTLVLTVLQLVEPEVAAQETTALVTVELEEQDALLVVVDGLPSSPWSSFGSSVMRGHELAEDVVVVLAVIEQPRTTLVLTVLQLEDPDVTAAQETTALVTVELEEQDALLVVIDELPSSP